MPEPTHSFTNLRRWAVATGVLLAVSAAAADEPPVWKTGAAFSRQLAEIVGVTWQERTLRDGLDRLSHAYGVAIFLDRRIDPDQHLDFAVADVPLSKLLQQLSAEAQAQPAVVGSVVYIGPRETASQVAAIAAQRRQDATRLPNEVRARLLRAEAWKWEELAQPRDLLRTLASQAGVTIDNAGVLPHDLWPAVSLPPLIWVDRMTLLLAGFGLTFEISEPGASLRLVPLPTMRVAEDRLPTAATAAEHVGKDKKAKAGEKLYSLKVQNEPAGNVVSTVAKSLGKELRYEPDVLEKLQQRVTFDLKDATLEHLMQTTLKPLGLTYRVTDKQLEIVPAQQ